MVGRLYHPRSALRHVWRRRWMKGSTSEGRNNEHDGLSCISSFTLNSLRLHGADNILWSEAGLPFNLLDTAHALPARFCIPAIAHLSALSESLDRGALSGRRLGKSGSGISRGRANHSKLSKETELYRPHYGYLHGSTPVHLTTLKPARGAG